MCGFMSGWEQRARRMANRCIPHCALLSWELPPPLLISVTGKRSEWPIKQLVQGGELPAGRRRRVFLGRNQLKKKQKRATETAGKDVELKGE